MSKAIQSAKSLAQRYDTCLNALNGALHVFLDSYTAMTIGELKRFQSKATAIATQSNAETLNTLKLVSEQIAREARLRAYRDARIDAPNVIVVSVDVTEINQLVQQEYMKATLEGVKLAKDLMSQHTLLTLGGQSPATARVRVRERNRGKILKIYSTDRSGRSFRTSWAMYLRLADFLTALSHREYLSASAALGFTNFELYQPDHRRHGLAFDLESIPTTELHPQSEAVIRLKRTD
ncbi:hypothetical protein JCM19235_1248 [Vibrio maritimus]|uniref:Uncharacterized protein n=1 Tax=Vibrio maritimus TaxID=990268 RepID=A0A090SUE5_9VIBR|nr:hypothetical protein JCM19235_1248 [Vibrio maritimus]